MSYHGLTISGREVLAGRRGRLKVNGMVSVLTFSDAGGHAINEDAFLVESHPADAACLLCFLADGQGGRAGGGQAAQVACSSAVQTARLLPPWKLAAPSTWGTILSHADAAVCADAGAGFTTLIGFCIAKSHVAGAACGDSALMAKTARRRPMELTAGQFKNPPVGSGAARFAPFGAALEEQWSVLAMSDGVWKYVGWDRLADEMLAVQGQQLLERLQGHARSRGTGRFADDFTVVLFEDMASAGGPIE